MVDWSDIRILSMLYEYTLTFYNPSELDDGDGRADVIKWQCNCYSKNEFIDAH